MNLDQRTDHPHQVDHEYQLDVDLQQLVDHWLKITTNKLVELVLQLANITTNEQPCCT